MDKTTKAKKIEDYLHLYLGCNIIWFDKNLPSLQYSGKLVGAMGKGPMGHEFCIYETTGDIKYPKTTFHEIKPILRPCSDLKSEEVGKMEWDNDRMWWAKKTKKGKITILYTDGAPSCFRPDEYAFLCSIGIDLFGLIEAGLAIDSTTLNPKGNG